MKFAICSDVHDNVWALAKALPQMKEADSLLFLGDFCSPFTLVQMAGGFSRPIHVVWGNNDGDKWLLTTQASRFDHVTLHGGMADLQIGGKRVAMNHYPNIARALAASDRYDLVCYGHDHLAHDERIGSTRLFNPGELMGRLGASVFALYDLADGTFDRIEVLSDQAR